MDGYKKVGKLSDFPDLRGTGVQIDGRDVCIARAGETVYAFEDRCSHAESLLSGSDIEDNEISCPLHGARFSIKTGEAMTPPAVKPIQTYDVKVEDGNVLVKL